MVLTYTCTTKCFFMGGIRRQGDRMVLDSKVGDACPHLVRTPTEGQLEMQGNETTEKKAEVSVPKAEAKAVSTPRKSNGGKAK